jgi:hypothetical protein
MMKIIHDKIRRVQTYPIRAIRKSRNMTHEKRKRKPRTMETARHSQSSPALGPLTVARSRKKRSSKSWSCGVEQSSQYKAGPIYKKRRASQIRTCC